MATGQSHAGLLCAAPVLGAWFRAVTVSYYSESDEVMLRFVDYGGYTRLPRSELRQIRTDLMFLPFQAIECYLAHVQPIDEDDIRKAWKYLVDARRRKKQHTTGSPTVKEWAYGQQMAFLDRTEFKG
ncbi:hypothetical protein COOONC_04078 [Cooperia oncophora]